MQINILIGGKFGDFIHAQYIPSFIYRTTGITSNIFVSNMGDSFEFGLENSFRELVPVMQNQQYCNSFQIFKNEKVDMDLSTFRQSKYLFKTCWTELLTKTFLGENIKPIHGAWMTHNQSFDLKDTILVSRKNKTPVNDFIISNYEKEIKKYKNAIFIGSDRMYSEFPLKDLCKKITPLDIGEIFSYFNSNCTVLGDQSGPMAVASALNATRILEPLPKSIYPDEIHYLGEVKYSNKISFIRPSI